MTVLEHTVEELRELVDGHEPWTHRSRLHELENDRTAAELAGKVLERANRRASDKFRWWGMFVIAVLTVVLDHVKHLP